MPLLLKTLCAQRKMSNPPPALLIDTSGYIFRAFHALPPITNPEGVPVGAVYGFVRMILKLIDDWKPEKIALIFDHARSNFRHDIYQNYKANRAALSA